MAFVTFTVVLCDMLYNGQLQTQFLYLLRRNLHDIGFTSLVAGICETVAVFPSSYLADRFRRDIIIRASGILGLVALGLHATAVVLRCLPLLYVTIALLSISVGLPTVRLRVLILDFVERSNVQPSQSSHIF